MTCHIRKKKVPSTKYCAKKIVKKYVYHIYLPRDKNFITRRRKVFVTF